jgi:hypothetical protein
MSTGLLSADFRTRVVHALLEDGKPSLPFLISDAALL